ncbi:hypothetical protein R83H12_00525 [Fibrobacteria bacterium R8-3-H12]
MIKFFIALFCLLANIAFADEDCISFDEALMWQIAAIATSSKSEVEKEKKAIKIMTEDCKERPYAFTFKKLSEDGYEVLSDTLPFFSAFSLDEYSKHQWLFDKEQTLFYNDDGFTIVSKQDLKLKLQGKGFDDQIIVLLSYADKNQIGVYYYETTEQTPYALVVAKRKYSKYISGSFFK